jgi:hypothetical protein
LDYAYFLLFTFEFGDTFGVWDTSLEILLREMGEALCILDLLDFRLCFPVPY